MRQIVHRNDFIESSEDAYITKAITYKSKLLQYKDILGIDDETVAKETTMIDKVLECKRLKDEAQQNAKARVKGFKNSQKTLTSYMRKRRLEMQTLSAYTDEIGIDMGLETTYTSIDTKDLVPEIQLNLEGGNPTIRFKKQGTDGIRIFSRLNAEGAFTFLDTCSGSSYKDIRLKTNPLEPELREYYVFYTLKGETVGQQSQTVQISL
jgi:hypothetical protein